MRDQLREALDQQAALSDVLGVISRSPFALDPVLDAVIQNAVRLSDADNGSLIRIENGIGSMAASFGMTDDAVAGLAEFYRAHPLVPGRSSLTGRVLMERRSVQIPDTSADPDYERPPGVKRSLLGVPLLRPDGIVGVIVVRRRTTGGFSAQQVKLVEAFAAQAVIAIENVRLFNETKEALDRQTAIAEILRVISSSPTDVQPVLDTIAESAARFCGAEDAGVALVRDDGQVDLIATFGSTTTTVGVFPLSRKYVTARAIQDARTYNVPDMEALSDEEYAEGKEFARQHGYRGFLATPLLKDGRALGAIQLRRRVAGAFSEQQVHLVETFASQAVIAIENVRLFYETKEALEQQRAISEVLSAISTAGSDVKPVFDAVVQKAGVLCDAEWSLVWQRQKDGFHLVSSSGSTDSFLETQRDRVEVLGRDSLVGRTALEKRPIHIPDVLADPEYGRSDDQLAGGYRTTLGVPILRDGEVIGVIALSRNQVRPFTDKQVDLVVTFADQAAIAIENVRLLQAVERQRQELTRFVSPQVASLLTSDEGQRLLEGHRRAITVLFCDLRGFSPFSETAEPEEVLGVLREYHAAMGELIVAHGGTLEHFAGDGMMVFFNDPVPVADHELRAVRLAVAMRDRFDGMAQAWHRKGYDLGFGIGAAVGHATLGRIGFEGRYDYGAIGNAVIIASRLSGEAKAGQILLTQRLHAAVEQHVDADAIGELSLKGQTRPVAAFNVRSLRAPE